jgi:hypothetical protein
MTKVQLKSKEIGKSTANSNSNKNTNAKEQTIDVVEIRQQGLNSIEQFSL